VLIILSFALILEFSLFLGNGTDLSIKETFRRGSEICRGVLVDMLMERRPLAVVCDFDPSRIGSNVTPGIEDTATIHLERKSED
jgi:hypothetical protein